jgi:undecaprenyl-diphosphatase
MEQCHTSVVKKIHLSALLLFAVMLVSVLNHFFLTEAADRWVAEQAAHLRTAWLTPVVVAVTDLNSLRAAGVFSLFVSGVFWLKGWYRDIGFYLVSTAGSILLFGGIKALVARTRPPVSVLETGGYAFPSGHTTMAAAMAFALYFVLKERRAGRMLHRMLFWTALGWVVLIASTRLYLGVHWLTDVLGGLGLGIGWVTFARLVWCRGQKTA